MSPRFAPVCLGFALFVAGAPVHAQYEEVRRNGGSYDVTFEDDALDALGKDVIVPRITVRPPPSRTLLIRVRTTFVPEMLKSVQNM